jgi:hypothetical protein
MRFVIAATMALAVVSGVALAEDAVPDMVGTWVGSAKSVVYGDNRFHPGDATPAPVPRVRELGWTMEITGQDGRVFWGQGWLTDDTAVRDTLALALAADGKTIIGAGDDGTHIMTLVGPDRIERCFSKPATADSGAIIAACGYYDRAK